MITRGQVRGVREMAGPAGVRVQASVCLGASPLGSAVVQVELKSPAVLEALMALKVAIASETMEVTHEILKDQLTWDQEKAEKAAAASMVATA